LSDPIFRLHVYVVYVRVRAWYIIGECRYVHGNSSAVKNRRIAVSKFHSFVP